MVAAMEVAGVAALVAALALVLGAAPVVAGTAAMHALAALENKSWSLWSGSCSLKADRDETGSAEVSVSCRTDQAVVLPLL